MTIQLPRAAAGNPACMGPWSEPFRTVPVTATPRHCPSCRPEEFIPLATPACSSGTLLITP
jgi:hypothetical protein